MITIETEQEVKDEIMQEDPTGKDQQVKAPAPELAHKIKEQVEYYFGDLNLARDKFLHEEMKKNDDWVPLDLMLKFNRLVKLTDDPEIIANALQDSQLVHVSGDGKKIRRNPEVPLPENIFDFWKEVKSRTVYMNGFSLDTHLDEIIHFVAPYGPVTNIFLKRVPSSKTFNGSVYITFNDLEAAQEFVRNDATRNYKGHELEKLMQMDYLAQKNQWRKERKQAANALKNTQTQSLHLNLPTLVKCVVLRVTGFAKKSIETGQKGMETADKLRDFFKPYAEVAFIAFNIGDDKVDIRFKSREENYAAKTWDAVVKAAPEGKVEFEGCELQGYVLDGEEEQRYWAEYSKSSAAKMKRFKNSDRGRRGRSGRGGGRGKGCDREHQSKGKPNVLKKSDEEEDESMLPVEIPDHEHPSKGKRHVFKDSDEVRYESEPPVKKAKDIDEEGDESVPLSEKSNEHLSRGKRRIVFFHDSDEEGDELEPKAKKAKDEQTAWLIE